MSVIEALPGGWRARDFVQRPGAACKVDDIARRQVEEDVEETMIWT